MYFLLDACPIIPSLPTALCPYRRQHGSNIHQPLPPCCTLMALGFCLPPSFANPHAPSLPVFPCLPLSLLPPRLPLYPPVSLHLISSPFSSARLLLSVEVSVPSPCQPGIRPPDLVKMHGYYSNTFLVGRRGQSKEFSGYVCVSVCVCVCAFVSMFEMCVCRHASAQSYVDVCVCVWTSPYLLYEDLRSSGAEQQDGSAESVPVAVELFCPHGGEEVGEHLTDVPVHPLKGHIHPLPGRLVQETLQPADIWGRRRRSMC